MCAGHKMRQNKPETEEFCNAAENKLIQNSSVLDGLQSVQPCEVCRKLALHTACSGSSVWEGMKELSLLYLRDNEIGKMANMHSLSSSPDVKGLTLFDTPLSLKIASRHIVVNGISSLKALGYYVISDEEIVGSWKLLTNRFPARRLSPGLCSEPGSVLGSALSRAQCRALSPVVPPERWIEQAGAITVALGPSGRHRDLLGIVFNTSSLLTLSDKTLADVDRGSLCFICAGFLSGPGLYSPIFPYASLSVFPRTLPACLFSSGLDLQLNKIFLVCYKIILICFPL
uniref:Uncharacterized protein n=1 Tax=Otus sunia TaxID=257818 RepID=A0A8C8BS90_9STRI